MRGGLDLLAVYRCHRQYGEGDRINQPDIFQPRGHFAQSSGSGGGTTQVRYKVVHITQYFYSDAAPLCHNVVHLMPRETPRQTRLSHALAINPNPESRNTRTDFFGNPVTWFSLQEPHTSLKIVARSEVDVRPFQPPNCVVPGRRRGNRSRKR